MVGETLQRVPMGRVEAHSMTMNGTEARKFDGAAGRLSLVDPFGRDISYLRVSVTDRCDFRCVYCMSENMAFLPKADVLTLEELDRLCSAFIARGVRKLRLTGGEPLVRRGIMTLVSSLSRHLHTGALDELTLTTNGSQLAKYAQEIKAAGVRRINVSLDTLDAEKFRAITRWGSLDQVLAGIDAALAAGLKIKINAVALKGVNDDEFPQLIGSAKAGSSNICRSRSRAPGFPSAFPSPTSTTAPADRRAMSASPRPAGSWASSHR
jgi:cyclic pyranopterin phosphate synthase